MTSNKKCELKREKVGIWTSKSIVLIFPLLNPWFSLGSIHFQCARAHTHRGISFIFRGRGSSPLILVEMEDIFFRHPHPFFRTRTVKIVASHPPQGDIEATISDASVHQLLCQRGVLSGPAPRSQRFWQSVQHVTWTRVPRGTETWFQQSLWNVFC